MLKPFDTSKEVPATALAAMRAVEVVITPRNGHRLGSVLVPVLSVVIAQGARDIVGRVFEADMAASPRGVACIGLGVRRERWIGRAERWGL